MRFTPLFNSKAASLFCFTIAIANRFINVLFVSFTGRDKMILVMQSKSWMEGKGFGLPQYFLNNPEIPVYDYTPFWPPGYPLMLAPFLRLFNYDVYWATTMLDLTCCIAFIFIARKIAVFLKFPCAAVNIVTLIAGCFEYEFISESLPTDIPSLVFFLSGFYLVLQLVQTEKKLPGKLFIAAVLLFLPCAFRYAYPPVSLAVPAIIILSGFYLRKKWLINKGVGMLAIISLLIAVFFIFLKLNTGASGYIMDFGRGIFPANIIYWAPVGPGSFINISFFISQMTFQLGIPGDRSIQVLQMINYGMILCIVLLFLYLFFKKKFFTSPDPFRWFLVLGFFISAATFGELGYLSLTYKAQPRSHFSWNYVTESRYYAFVFFFLQVSFLGWAFLYPAWKKSIIQKIIVYGLSGLLFIEITHNIYFHTKVALNFNRYKSSRYQEADYDYFVKLVQLLARNNPEAAIWVAADKDWYYPLMASYLGYKGIFDSIDLNKKFPVVKKKTILVIALYNQGMANYQPFFSNKSVQFIKRVAEGNFYFLVLNPD